MDWRIPYTVSRALVLQIGNGGLVARNSVSRQPQSIAPDALPVLLAFGGGRMPREALAELRDEWEIDEAGFQDVVGALVAQNLLTPAGNGGATPADGGFASIVPHISMLKDNVRVGSYQQAISRHCRGRTVVEIGCGTGILSIFAARAGARRVIAIEESAIADVAAEMFRANGVADTIELRRANSRDVSLDERADVIIHEVLGADPFSENVLAFIEDARERLLAPGGRMIPYALDVCCAGFEVLDRPYLDARRAAVELQELGALYGIDFAPLGGTLDDRLLPRPLGDLGQMHFAPRILTDETLLYHLDFRAPVEVEPRKELRLRAIRAGSLGGVLVWFRAHLDEQTVLSTSPYAPRTPSWDWNARPLERLIAIEPGDEIAIAAEVRTVLGLERLHVGLG
jgi:precorrin-6B methylase 2